MTTSAEIDVIVPTFRRPEQLERCLLALGAQRHRPAAVIVVLRADDEESKVALAHLVQPQRRTHVETPRDAIRTFFSSGIERLLLENYEVWK